MPTKTIIGLIAMALTVVAGSYACYLIGIKHSRYFAEEKSFREAYRKLRRDFPRDALTLQALVICFTVMFGLTTLL